MPGWEKNDCKSQLTNAKNQQEAIEIYLSRKKDDPETLVISEDVSVSYKKKFFVSSYSEFLKKLYRTPLNKRHFYEVIVADQPVRLHLDIEYKVEWNPDNCGNKILKKFLNVFNEYLTLVLNVKILLEDCLILDSSIPSKFSKHVIYIIERNEKEYLFKNNTIIKEYIMVFERLLYNYLGVNNRNQSYLCQPKISLDQSVNDCNAATSYEDQVSSAVQDNKFLGKFTRNLCKSFLINLNENKQKGLFLDDKIYTRNRQFRTIFSTKFNKNSNLVICPLSPIKYNKKVSRKDFLKCTFVTLISENHAALFDAFPRDNKLFDDHLLSVSLNDKVVKKNVKNNSQCIYQKNLIRITSHVNDIMKQLIFDFCETNKIDHKNVGSIRETRYSGDNTVFCDLYCQFCLNVKRMHRNNKGLKILSPRTTILKERTNQNIEEDYNFTFIFDEDFAFDFSKPTNSSNN